MQKRKLKPFLFEKTKNDKEFNKKQESLKNKYGIEKDVVIVEKNNILKLVIRTSGGVIRISSISVLISLAFVGLLALVYPEPRDELFNIFSTIFLELQSLLK